MFLIWFLVYIKFVFLASNFLFSLQVLVFQTEGDPAIEDEEHGDRDKRKIGVVKLGVTNGIIGFVFGVS